MTDEHDHDLLTDVSDGSESVEAEDVPQPAQSVAAAVTEGVKNGTVPLASGGVLLLAAVRSAVRGQIRAIPKGIVGGLLIRYGLDRRRSSEKADANGEREDDETIESEGTDSDSKIEFVDDDGLSEPRSKPTIDEDESSDPRRSSDEGGTEIDVSDAAMADEPGEATGPDPEQAQPAQTESTEPEPTPEEDAAEMRVDPEEGDEPDDGETSTEDETGSGETDADDETGSGEADSSDDDGRD
ncbi:hypothetical protein [Natrarchaeobius chitinivorans]|uniref:Uncharacterized protein n=1 Tax=Natrarchaeobius chitinivorans TaxID=1679083 RepID=A0A3N6LWA8_NATCH|nr:hypothetical protein [Natrarchaeobius chitinivorans]RQG92004.1 hypothetical protein EA473_18060 [Natrarchaeobius chitinivorans]